MGTSHYLILEADPAAVVRRSASWIYVSYAVAVGPASKAGAGGYAIYQKWFDPWPSEREVLHPNLAEPELNTRRSAADLETLAELIKNDADAGCDVYTLPPERQFARDTPHPPVRALTRDEVETVRRLIGD